MNSFNLNNFTVDLVEKTIHYIRYNIIKDSEPFVMCSINKDGKMEVKPYEDVFTISNYNDIFTYNNLIQNLYRSSIELLSYDSIPSEGDTVIVLSNTDFNIKNGILYKLNLVENMAIVDTNGLSYRRPIKNEYIKYPLNKIIPINQEGLIKKLKADRSEIIQKKVSIIDTEIKTFLNTISHIKAVLPILKYEVDNLEKNIIIDPTEGRKKSLKCKIKGIKRKEKKLKKYSIKMSSLLDDKKETVEDFQFNNCITVALKKNIIN